MDNVNTFTATVAAVKKTKHGAYGQRLAMVTVVVPAEGWERAAHAAALPLLAALLPALKITTEIVTVSKAPTSVGDDDWNVEDAKHLYQDDSRIYPNG